MGGRLSVIAKGRLMKLIDQSLQAPTPAFLDELTSGTSMVQLGLAKQILSLVRSRTSKTRSSVGRATPRRGGRTRLRNKRSSGGASFTP